MEELTEAQVAVGIRPLGTASDLRWFGAMSSSVTPRQRRSYPLGTLRFRGSHRSKRYGDYSSPC